MPSARSGKSKGDLVVDGTTYRRFYSDLQADPFLAGVSRASTEPMRISSVMDFSSVSVLLAIQNYERFQQAVKDPVKWQRFQHGWSAAFALSTSYAFDHEADDERRHVIEDTLDLYGYSSTLELADNGGAVARYMKEEEYKELQRGMTIFGAANRWARNLDSDFNGYTNFYSIVNDIGWRLRGTGPFEPHEPDLSLDGVGVVLADETARRMTAAFTLGHSSMTNEYYKENVFQ